MMAIAILAIWVLNLHAQARHPSVEQQFASLQRLEAMHPDSIGPKYQQAVLLLGFVCSQPGDSKAQQYIDEALRVIQRIEAMTIVKDTERSDLATLQGFYYTALIVTNPRQNGPRYYRQAIDHFDEALRLNPHNELAQMLMKKFKEGMNGNS